MNSSLQRSHCLQWLNAAVKVLDEAENEVSWSIGANFYPKSALVWLKIGSQRKKDSELVTYFIKTQNTHFYSLSNWNASSKYVFLNYINIDTQKFRKLLLLW